MKWHDFRHDGHLVLVRADTEELARAVLARHAWNGKDPGWTYFGQWTVVPCA